MKNRWIGSHYNQRAVNILKHHNISNVTNGGSWIDVNNIVNEINSTKSNQL